MGESSRDRAIIGLNGALLGIAVFLFVAVVILARLIQQLVTIVNDLKTSPVAPCSYENPATETELNDLKDPETPYILPKTCKRPISGTNPWKKGSMESIVIVPSREESPMEKFLSDNNLLDMKITSFERFQTSADN